MSIAAGREAKTLAYDAADDWREVIHGGKLELICGGRVSRDKKHVQRD